MVEKHTWNDILSIHGVIVFDESKAIHEFDLGDITGTMFLEVRLNVFLGDCSSGLKVSEIPIELGNRTSSRRKTSQSTRSTSIRKGSAHMVVLPPFPTFCGWSL